MAKKEHRFNPQTLTYELMRVPFKLRTYRLLRKLLIGFILVSLANVVFSTLFYTPKLYKIYRDNREMVIKYRIMQDKIRASQHKLDEIKQRDNSVYRALFSTDTLAIEGIYTPYPDQKYKSMAHDAYSSLMTQTWQQLDAYSRTLYAQSVSFDELQILSKNKEQLSSAIPAIWPIDRTRLRGGVHAFGMRRHPITHRYARHLGVDMAGRIGDPVYATGDAVVEAAGSNIKGGSGYGNQILLNHKFGYKTRYAHLNRVLVRPGDKVVRGQLIGEVGNTGRSTGPHLHYEVIFKGQHVNPINYFNRDVTPDEYKRMIEQMSDNTTLETDEGGE